MTIQLGWGDPIESEISVLYRQKGVTVQIKFSGAVAVLGSDRRKLSWLTRSEIPLQNGKLDLTKVPVIGIGGKRKHQPQRATDFLDQNPGFQGALLLHPGTGNWDLGEGMIFITSLEILSGRKVSGGRPEVQLINKRWLNDGRLVMDRARVLHGKALEILDAELEQVPDTTELAKAIAERSFSHRLTNVLQAVIHELKKLEERRVMFATTEKERNVFALVVEKLAQKLRESGVVYARDIPDDFTLTAEEVAPELVLGRDEFGYVEVPGVGRKLVKKLQTGPMFDKTLAIELTICEFRKLESWPFAGIYPAIPELGDVNSQLSYGLTLRITAPGAERVAKISEFFSDFWRNSQRSSNRPKDFEAENPAEQTPKPVVWGFELMTGEPLVAYPALTQNSGRSRIASEWVIRWYDSQGEASTHETESRRALAKKLREPETKVRRLEVEELLSRLEAEMHIWVSENGEVAFVLGGKISKMGRFEVLPSAGDRANGDRPYCNGHPSFSLWVPFQLGVRSKVRDFTASGKLVSEKSLFVPKGFLAEGVYGVGADEKGDFFFPVIYHDANGDEVVPQVHEVQKIRVPREVPQAPVQSPASVKAPAEAMLRETQETEKPVDLGGIDLSGLFGGVARTGNGNKGKDRRR